MLSHPSSWFGHMMPADFCSSRGGIANVLNPIDHPWNFDSSTVAKRRVRAVTRADRQASGDGKWVKVRGRGVGVPWTCYISLNPVVKDLIRHWEREDKPRYRWEARR